MAAMDGHMFCSACKEPCSATEDFTSDCCWEPIQNEEGAGLTVEMIMAYIDEDDRDYDKDEE